MDGPRDDLTQLRDQFPGWRFGSVWATAASGPDRRRLWARNGDVLLSDWSAAGLSAAITVEQRRTGPCPDRPPSGSRADGC